MNALKLLVVAAWEPELVRFRERLAGGLPGPDVEIVLETLGVGLIEAAISTTQCVVRHRPDYALLIGTCGVFPGAGELRPGAVVAGARVGLADASVQRGAAALPEPMPSDALFDGALHDALVAAGARSVQIANTLGITTEDELAVQLAAGGFDVEHLEALSFARACARAGVPCGAALGIANVVGSKGRAEWLAGHVEASASAADLAYAALAGATLRSSTTERSPGRA